MHLSTLSAWLDWIGSVHNKKIDLGLDRIRIVATRLSLLKPSCKVITVGGTNGKGSVVAGLEAVYLEAGYRVGAFTSPYLFVHNEEVRVNGKMADDEAFIRAFEKIEAARGEVSLTPFEYHTLAALLIFTEASLDVMILEVGLGGRLDAVNIIDADAVVITSIGIDHVDWLGHTREAIAIEKAGIFRAGKPVVCGDDEPPPTLTDAAQKTGAVFYQRGKDFHFTEMENEWGWQTNGCEYTHLPRNTLLTQNMASVLMMVHVMQSLLPVTEEAMRRGLQSVMLPGRIQIESGPVTIIFDVSHNPAAAVILSSRLHSIPCAGKTVAVFSMLADKDIAGTIAVMAPEINEWFVAPLTCQRAASLEELKGHFGNVIARSALSDEAIQTITGQQSNSPAGLPCPANKAGLAMTSYATNVHFYSSIKEAYQTARNHTQPGDRIVIFGSFYTVAELMPATHLELAKPAH